jgi:ribonuclease BN (tRNA processing enzyme)
MSLALTVLGCSGSYPAEGEACSGYLVSGGGAHVVVDLGPGSLANLQHHIGLDEIDAVVLTHSHPDHWTDLAGLRVAWRYGLERKGLHVWGTPATRAMVEAVTEELAPTLVWHDLGASSVLVAGGLCFTFAPTQHYVETFAVRVDGPGGELLVYSADTGPKWDTATLGPEHPIFGGRSEADRTIDLLLCEATHLADGEGPEILHLSARQAGGVGAALGARRLVLTHFWPGGDPHAYRAEAAATFGGRVEVAQSNATFAVP